MNVEIFKTDVVKKNQAEKILLILNNHFPHFKINFDLDDCDKILRVEGERIAVEKIIALLHQQKILCEQLS